MNMDVRAALKRISPVELGARVRKARVAAGLTQAELAGGDASVAYVSRIESGQRRPDLSVLEAFAPRLGVSVEDLLTGIRPDARAADQLQLDYAELALRSSEPQRAASLAAELLERYERVDDPEFIERVRLVRAAALEATGDVIGALDVLETVIDSDAIGVTSRAIAAVSLSRCYRETGDLGRAIAIGESTLALLAAQGLDGTDEAVRLASTVAAAYFERGDVTYAVRLCRKAVEQAEASSSPAARASAYWNASIMQSEGGDPASALPLARRALALLEESDHHAHIGRLKAQLAVIQMQVDPPELAEAINGLEQAAADFEMTGGSAVDRTRVTFHLAQAHFLAGDLGQARTLANKATCSDAGAPRTKADAYALLGQVDAAEGDVAGARENYRRAVLTLAVAGEAMDRQTAQLWLDLASLLESVGLETAALDAYRRSAASSGLRPSSSRSSTRLES